MYIFFYEFKGRIKELIITSGGENVAPYNIEQAILSELPYLSNTMVIGDQRKYLTALVTLKVRCKKPKIQI
jgi:long-chain-fatty-acid--CoA ligase ACSBG